MKTRSCLNHVSVTFRRQAAPALCCALVALAFGTLPTQAVPNRSSPIAISPANLLVGVNPDTDTISVFDASAATPVKLGEVTVGREPSSIAISRSGGTAYVANAADGTVSVVDLATRTQVASVNAGAEPMALALSPNGTRLYVANSASGNLMVFNTATVAPSLLATVDLSAFGTAPRAIAVTDDGDADDTDETIFVALFYAQLRPGRTFLEEGQDDQREGHVVAISAATSTVLGAPNPVALGPIANTGFNSNGQLAPGNGLTPAVPQTNPQTFTTPTAAFPNQLAGLAIRPTDQVHAYIVSTAASPNGPVRFNQNMHGLISVLNTVSRAEITAAQTDPTVRRTAPLNLNQGVNLATTPAPRLFNSNPTAIAWRPDGSDAWITVQQSDLLLRMTVDAGGIPSINAPLVAGPSTIVRVDLQGGAIPGKAPRGVVINAAGTRAYVLNYVSRSISIVDISNPTAPAIAASVPATALPAPNTPDAVAQLGAEMFFSGRGPNGGLASEAWGSCAACHPNGRADNVTWMFDAGPRQTIALDGTFGPSHQKALQRILNWSAVRDEVHDFELNSRNVSGGRGLIEDDRLFLAFGGGGGPAFADTNLVEQFQQFTGTIGTTNDLAGQAIPALPSARRDFAIATLDDGRVFIIGGRSGPGLGTLVAGADTVLEFNARSNTFRTRSATSFTPRHSLGAAAVRTSTGFRIYAVGGYASTTGADSPIGTVQEYNPATDTWRTVASLPIAVAQFGITVAGGINTAEPLQLIHVISGNTGSEAAPSVANPNPVQRFQADPAGPGTWTPFNPAGLTLRRNHGVAAVLRGVSSRVFVIGGQDAAGTVLDTVEEYLAQAVTLVATPHTSLPAPRARFGVAGSLSTQQIYVFGGVDGTGADMTTVFEYTVANNGPVAGPPGTPSGSWVTRGNLSGARSRLQVSTPPGVVNFLPFANTGRNAAQDALAEFVRLRLRPAKAPVPATDPGAQAGRTLFGTVGLVQPGVSCATCHGGANWTRSIVDYTAPPSPEVGLGFGNERVIGAELRQTASQNPAFPGSGQAPGVLINVGTFTPNSAGGRVNEIRFNAADISQAVAPLGASGFNIPSLLSLHETAPYFYSGLAQTLEEVLNGSKDGNGGTQQHFVPNPTQRAQLVAFVRSIDDTTPIFAGAPGDTIINCSTNVVAECAGGLTPVTYVVTATNNNGPVPVNCVPPSGTGFQLGTSNVVCTAPGAATSCNFTVTVQDTKPPTMFCPGDFLVRSTNGIDAQVSFSAAASDDCGIRSFNCSPSGISFPIGVTTVTCTASDRASHTNSCSFTITVTECPLIFKTVLSGGQEVPPNASPATGVAIVELSADETQITVNGNYADLTANSTAAHIHGPAGPGTNAPVIIPLTLNPFGARSGSIQGQALPITSAQVDSLKKGLLYVNVHSTGFPGGEIRGQLLLGNLDCVPVLNCPTNIVAECTGGLTPVTYVVTATNGSGLVPVTCVPPSGTGFRLGASNVVCTATDAGLSSSCTFIVTVVDTTPPQVTCPGDITLQTTNTAGAVVSYIAIAADACGIATFNCSPPSGSLFPIGTTAVACSASDPSGNTNSCSFHVTVLGARGLKLDCLTNLVALRAGVTDRHDGQELDDAIEHLTRSLDSALWIDQNHLQRKGGDKVFEEEKKAVHELVELLKDKKSTVADADLLALIDCILRADRLLAVVAVDEAEAAGVKPKKIAEDRKEIAKGDDDAGKGKYEDAIEHYRNAWKHAVHVKIDPPHRFAMGSTRVTFIGIEGETYAVQASSDLVHWTTIGTAQANADGEVDVALDDPGADWQLQRFYRVISP